MTPILHLVMVVKIKYLKLEREFQHKHQGCINYYYIQYVLNKWNIDPKDIDAVAYVTDMSNYQLDNYSNELVSRNINLKIFT
jgi:predicted NodU family carbamoyl transferase